MSRDIVGTIRSIIQRKLSVGLESVSVYTAAKMCSLHGYWLTPQPMACVLQSRVLIRAVNRKKGSAGDKRVICLLAQVKQLF